MAEDATLPVSSLHDTPVEWPCERLATTEGILMDFVVDRVTTPDGSTMVRNYLHHPDSVGIIALDDQERVAIVAQYRHPVRAKLIEAPAGLCDHVGEASVEAAKRELAEEVGLSASDWRILADTYATPGCSSQSTRIFLARSLTPVARPEGFELEGEEADMSIGWAGLDDVVEGIYAGRLRNPTIVSGIMTLKAALLSNRVESLRRA